MSDRREPSRFDFTINIPGALALVALLGSLWGLTIRLENRITQVETKVEMLIRMGAGALRAIVFLSLLGSSLAYAQGPPPQATVNNRFEWDQVAPSVNEAALYVFKYYLDNGTVGVTFASVSCVGTLSPFLCSVSVPNMNQGAHTIQLTASNTAGESPKSAPFAFAFVVQPGAPANIRIR